ncbi:hypothetical protein G7046_g8833 [Stylonectria norvegica]|nr:hypothetical protein G7046_g8833 [Stylonectria norvegica]
MDAQNAAQSDQTKPAGASPSSPAPKPKASTPPPASLSSKPVLKPVSEPAPKPASKPVSKPASPVNEIRVAADLLTAPDANPADDRDSDAETIVLPGKDGHSPSKVRKVRQEDKSDGDGDSAKGPVKPSANDAEKNSPSNRPVDGAAKRPVDGARKKRLTSNLDRDKQARSKDGSSGLSSAPASPPQNQHQQRRRSVDPRSSSDSEYSHHKPFPKTSLRDKLKSGERLLPHKRKAPKPDSDDDADAPHPRRQRTTSTGLDPSRQAKEHKSAMSKSHHDSSNRSISPPARTHRRSASTQLPSLSSNGLGQKKKRLPPPLQSTEYHSDDSSASGSTHPRSSKLRGLATPATADANLSPAKMAPHKKHLDAHGQTFLARACARGEYDSAKQRLGERPEDLNVADYAGNTPLQIAAINGCEDIVKLLIGAGCNLDCVNYDKDTPLLDAVDNGHLGVVKLLLDAGVNPRKANVNGEEPIDRVDADTENADEIRKVLTDAKKRAGERRKTSEDRHSHPDNHDARDSHAPESPRDSPAAASGAIGRRGGGTVRSTKTRNDLLYMPLDDKTLRQAARRGDEETVARILQVKDGYDDPDAMVAAARGGHDLVIQLLLGLGGANPDPGPVPSLQSEFATPILAAIGQENIKVVELLLEQQGFDPTRRYKGETYYEIARRRQGTNWKEEEHMLKKSYDDYKCNNKDSTSTKSPRRREREKEREDRDAKRARRADTKEESRMNKRNLSSPARENDARKKSITSKGHTPKDKRRSNSFTHHDHEQQKRGPGRPRKEERVSSINVSDREVSPTLSHKQLRTKLTESDAAGVSSDGDLIKPRRKLVSKGELRGEREKQRRASMASNASSLKDHPTSPHDSRHEEPSDKHRGDKLSEKYHDRTKALKRDESRDRLPGDGSAKRHRTSITPDRPGNGEKDDVELPSKRRRLDGENKEKRHKQATSADDRPRRPAVSHDSSTKPPAKASHKQLDDDRRETHHNARRRDSGRSNGSDKSIHVKSEDVDVEMQDADSLKASADANAQALREKEEQQEKEKAKERAKEKEKEKEKIRLLDLEEAKKKKREEDRKRIEAEEKEKERKKRELEEAQKREEEEKKRLEEEEEKRKETERKRLEDEQKRLEEEKKRKVEEEEREADRKRQEAEDLQRKEHEEKLKREAEEKVRREEEENRRLEEEQRKKDEEERRQREEDERLRQEQLEREAAEEARRIREEEERKERERRERLHREDMERKRAAREAELRRIREEQERARLDKLPPLLRWLDTCPNPKIPTIAEKFKRFQGARYDTIRPEKNSTAEGREQWVLNTHVALLLGEKDLALSRYTAWDRAPVTELAKITLWKVEWPLYSLQAEKLWDLGLQLPNYYDGEDPAALNIDTKRRLKEEAWQRFSKLDMFFVKVSDLMYTVPNVPHLRDIELSSEYRELMETREDLSRWGIRNKWKQDPDVARFHGFAPRHKYYVNGTMVGEELPTSVQTSKVPFPEVQVPRRGLLRVYPNDPEYVSICLKQGLEHLVNGHRSPPLPNGSLSSPISQKSATSPKFATNGTNGVAAPSSADLVTPTNGALPNGTNGPSIKDIEAEMAKTQKNKATSFHLGQLKAKLAKLKRELLNPTTNGGGGGPGQGFDVARTGVASIGFIGFPSVGKSTLMSHLTGQHSEVAAYEFTTLTSVPGQVVYNGAPLQMIDLPGIIEGAKDGRGRGRQVIAVAKTCNLIFIVLDVNKPLTDKRVIEAELEGFGIRINKEPPNIIFKKKDKGGLNITSSMPLTHIDNDEIRAVMSEYRINSADITIRCDATVDDLIDILEAKSRSYIPVVYCLNKIDQISIEELDLLYRIPNAVPISSEHGWNVDELMECMWDKLNLVRAYTKPHGKQPDYSQPVILRANRCTVEDFVSFPPGSGALPFCNAIHRSITEVFKTAIVYGKSVKHQPQRVGLSHELCDEDVASKAASRGMGESQPRPSPWLGVVVYSLAEAYDQEKGSDVIQLCKRVACNTLAWSMRKLSTRQDAIMMSAIASGEKVACALTTRYCMEPAGYIARRGGIFFDEQLGKEQGRGGRGRGRGRKDNYRDRDKDRDKDKDDSKQSSKQAKQQARQARQDKQASKQASNGKQSVDIGPRMSKLPTRALEALNALNARGPQWFDLHSRGPLDLRPPFPAEAWDAAVSPPPRPPGLSSYCKLGLHRALRETVARSRGGALHRERSAFHDAAVAAEQHGLGGSVRTSGDLLRVSKKMALEWARGRFEEIFDERISYSHPPMTGAEKKGQPSTAADIDTGTGKAQTRSSFQESKRKTLPQQGQRRTLSPPQVPQPSMSTLMSKHRGTDKVLAETSQIEQATPHRGCREESPDAPIHDILERNQHAAPHEACTPMPSPVAIGHDRHRDSQSWLPIARRQDIYSTLVSSYGAEAYLRAAYVHMSGISVLYLQGKIHLIRCGRATGDLAEQQASGAARPQGPLADEVLEAGQRTAKHVAFDPGKRTLPRPRCRGECVAGGQRATVGDGCPTQNCPKPGVRDLDRAGQLEDQPDGETESVAWTLVARPRRQRLVPPPLLPHLSFSFVETLALLQVAAQWLAFGGGGRRRGFGVGRQRGNCGRIAIGFSLKGELAGPDSSKGLRRTTYTPVSHAADEGLVQVQCHGAVHDEKTGTRSKPTNNSQLEPGCPFIWPNVRLIRLGLAGDMVMGSTKSRPRQNHEATQGSKNQGKADEAERNVLLLVGSQSRIPVHPPSPVPHGPRQSLAGLGLGAGDDPCERRGRASRQLYLIREPSVDLVPGGLLYCWLSFASRRGPMLCVGGYAATWLSKVEEEEEYQSAATTRQQHRASKPTAGLESH